jgi:hypothetical protein
MELSYTGDMGTGHMERRGPFDPTGLNYIWECRACNQKRRRDRTRTPE